MKELKLIVLNNIKDIGSRVDKYLQEINNEDKSYVLPINECRFNNGEAKVTIDATIRDIDVYILSDVGNYEEFYNMHGYKVPMSPDEHFQDIKRCISALSGYASRITVIMPLLYQSRQDKRKGRESLDCALALQELERLHTNHIVTFDCHAKSVSNAIPNLPFENFYPTNIILEDLIRKEDVNDMLVISPDMGAMERARYYADMLSTDVGLFYKRRDLTKVVNGKNPVIEHSYMGSDVAGKTVLVVDDMIASGGSILEVGKMLRERGARKIYFTTTFSLFTEGIEVFDKAYSDGLFDKLYTTNLSHIKDEYKEKEWLEVVDCSKRIAEIVDALHKGNSLKKVVNGNDKIIELLKEKQETSKVLKKI